MIIYFVVKYENKISVSPYFYFIKEFCIVLYCILLHFNEYVTVIKLIQYLIN